MEGAHFHAPLPTADDILGTTIRPLVRVMDAVGLDVRRTLQDALGCDARHAAHLRLESLGRDELTAFAYRGYTDLDKFAHGDTERLSLLSREGFLLFCRMLLTCSTLREAIALTVDYHETLGQGRIAMRAEQRGDRILFTHRLVWPHPERGTVLLDLLGLAAFHRLFSWLIGRALPMGRAAVTADERWQSVLGETVFPFTSVGYDAEANGFEFPAALLDHSTTRTLAEFRDLLPGFPYDIVGYAYERCSMGDRVGQIFRSRILGGDPVPTISMVSGAVDLTPSTLRRRLALEGLTVGAIKKRCRLEAASTLLRGTALNIDEVAWRVGFSDASAFRRAFRHWAGQSPRAFRATRSTIGERKARDA
jgi:AraC-like DNA-binding protein